MRHRRLHRTHRRSIFLIEGLRRLEYRGYDSSGVVHNRRRPSLQITKTAGRVDDLAAKLQK